MTGKIIKIMLLFIMLNNINCFPQSNNQEDTLRLNNITLVAKLPVPKKIQTNHFEHNSILITYIFEDGWIYFLEGSMINLWIDNYLPSTVENRIGFKTASGTFNNMYWRRDYYAKCRIYYDQVLPSAKLKYDNILNSIQIINR